MEMISDRVVVDFGNAAFLSADHTGEIAEMVDGQRKIGSGGFADWLAVVPGFGGSERRQVFLNPVSNAIEDERAFSRARLAPGILGGMRCIKSRFDISGIRAGYFAKHLTIDR